MAYLYYPAPVGTAAYLTHYRLQDSRSGILNVLQRQCCYFADRASFFCRVTGEILSNEYIPESVRRGVEKAVFRGKQGDDCGKYYPCQDLDEKTD